MKLAVGVQDAYQNKDLQLQSYAGGSKSPPTSLAAISELLDPEAELKAPGNGRF